MPYDTALICKNGHLINSAFHQHSEMNTPFCEQCGALAISKCSHCNTGIKGIPLGQYSYLCNYNIPSYCAYCGNPFPWTSAAIESTALIIQEEEALTEQQRESLIASLPDVIVETPKTNLAAVRIKKCLSVAGKFTIDAIRQFTIEFGCELAKNLLGF